MKILRLSRTEVTGGRPERGRDLPSLRIGDLDSVEATVPRGIFRVFAISLCLYFASHKPLIWPRTYGDNSLPRLPLPLVTVRGRLEDMVLNGDVDKIGVQGKLHSNFCQSL